MEIKLALLFSIVVSFGFGQRERNLDSIAKANVKAIVYNRDHHGYFSTDPSRRFKLTISAGVNSNLNFSNIGHFKLHDYFNFGAYDIRARFYITHNIKIFQRVLVTGLYESNYFFTTGLIKKF